MSELQLEPSVLKVLTEEFTYAVTKHPVFPSVTAGLSVIVEEVGELSECLNKLRGLHGVHNGNERPYLEGSIIEAAHIAVTALRMLQARIQTSVESGNSELLSSRGTKIELSD